MEIFYSRQKIEDATASIRRRHQILYKDIEKIVDQGVWNADVFGYWPIRQEIELTIKSRSGVLKLFLRVK